MVVNIIRRQIVIHPFYGNLYGYRNYYIFGPYQKVELDTGTFNLFYN